MNASSGIIIVFAIVTGNRRQKEKGSKSLLLSACQSCRRMIGEEEKKSQTEIVHPAGAGVVPLLPCCISDTHGHRGPLGKRQKQKQKEKEMMCKVTCQAQVLHVMPVVSSLL